MCAGLEAHAAGELRECRQHEALFCMIDHKCWCLDASCALRNREHRMQMPAHRPCCSSAFDGIMAETKASKFKLFAHAVNAPLGWKRPSTSVVVSFDEAYRERATRTKLGETLALAFADPVSGMSEITDHDDDACLRTHRRARETNQGFLVDSIRRRCAESAVALTLSDMKIGDHKCARRANEERALRHELDIKAIDLKERVRHECSLTGASSGQIQPQRNLGMRDTSRDTKRDTSRDWPFAEVSTTIDSLGFATNVLRTIGSASRTIRSISRISRVRMRYGRCTVTNSNRMTPSE